MHLRKVVITGTGAVSPFGKGVEILVKSLLEGKSGIVVVPELEEIGELRSRLGALVQGVDPKEIPRKHRRTMSRMSVYALLACQEALAQSGLSPQGSNGRMGVVLGSTVGSTDVLEKFFKDYLTGHSMEGTRSTIFFQIMNHTCASNVAQALGIEGRVLAPAAACSTGCQAVGLGYETIALGKQDTMLCGGADEFHPLTIASFDLINAASFNYNDQPHKTPRPFDRDRDGIVCAEGCGILLLESLESAEKRGASILGEVAGFSTVSDPSNIADPSASSMERCMMQALSEAHLEPGDVDYVNAHATATIQGDIAESEAIYRLFGPNVPVSSLKGHLGHTMAASGALELIATLDMMNRRCLIPTLNLENVDELCHKIRHVRTIESLPVHTAIKNSFALGGVNSSVIVRRYKNDE